jgi:hypothetical protein
MLRRRHALKKLQAAASSFTRDRHVPWQVVITMGKETLPSHLTIAKSYTNTAEIAKCRMSVPTIRRNSELTQ